MSDNQLYITKANLECECRRRYLEAKNEFVSAFIAYYLNGIIGTAYKEELEAVHEEVMRDLYILLPGVQ